MAANYQLSPPDFFAAFITQQRLPAFSIKKNLLLKRLFANEPSFLLSVKMHIRLT